MVLFEGEETPWLAKKTWKFPLGTKWRTTWKELLNLVRFIFKLKH